MNDFTHLHTHSHYSLLDGLGQIDDLVDQTKALGMNSLAITDHGSMYGIIEFVQAAQKGGIKPIIGMEGYLAPNGHTNKRGKIDANPRHLTLIASTNEGYKNLIKLNTIAQLEGYYYKPRIDYDLLEKYYKGLIVLSGCLNGDISKAIVEKRPDDAKRLIEWHINLLGRDHFYLEVQSHPTLKEQVILNEALVKYAKEYKLGLVATADSHYIHPHDAEAQDVLICVQTGKTVQDTDRLNMMGEDFSLKSPEEVKETWKEHPEAVDNTQKIAEMCNVTFEFGVNRLPRYPLPKEQSADDALRVMCLQGLKDRYGETLPENAHTRLDYELDVIRKTGYASYFLIVQDFVNEAKRRGILVGPGRGSAAGSLVSYLTNITNVDPLYYNLLFERFLNPERVSMPDIDLDFADDRRGEVIDYVREKYGAEHVAQIITFGTMAARAAVRDAGRALAYPYAFCDKVAKLIPQFTDFKEALQDGTELRQLYDADPQAKKLVDMAQKLEGVCRHASTHAAGVVITDLPITEYVPLQLSSTADGSKDTVTQYAMGAVEALGLLKMDFLGLKNLTVIQKALDYIYKRHGVKVDIDHLPEGDPKSYKLLQLGQTTGVFQLESSGMKRYLKDLKPTEFEDIISIGALYRPGPMDSIPDFIAAKHGRKKITYLHPILKPILEKTYGVIVTQDQVLEIAREFAGFSYAEADILRKAVGKKIKELLDEQRNKFINGAVNVKKIDKNTAAAVWDFIEPFARYGFNRAHAACYAMIAYQTAYLKSNYPAEFMAALLTSDEGNTDRQAIEIAESVAMDIKVLPPSLNKSELDFTVDDDNAIRFGLGAIKNVGHGVVNAIIAEREARGPFKDLSDVFARVNSKDFNRKSVESLARAGAFDEIPDAERNSIITHVETLLEFNRGLHRKMDVGQKNLFGAGSSAAAPLPRISLPPVTPATKEERLAWERELMGLYISEHPLAELQKAMSEVLMPLFELQGCRDQETVRVGGLVSRSKKIVTKSGQPMIFAQLEDLTGGAEMVIFPKLYQTVADMIVDGAKLIIEGKVSDKDAEKKLLADKVFILDKNILQSLPTLTASKRRGSLTGTSDIVIHLPESFSRERLLQLKATLAKYHAHDGGVGVHIVVSKEGKVSKITTSFKIVAEPRTLNELTAIVGLRSVRQAL